MAHQRITIRNIETDLIQEAREFAVVNGWTLGEVFSEALYQYFFEEADPR